ncbi:GTPase ObgE [Candidatus Johnevansia muelleri]|uniref:GTPase Obg n=1 Tax=Candidatus Johnevansia muelleri TaxID=1495769 RepID=A0A078KEA0_9GAMM|nr:GTPase ObgE [Candidatus Evansia muelleri]
MQFIDKALIFIKAGQGGNGCLSFRREKFISKGGPNGGNGGNGGNIFIIGDNSINTLSNLKSKYFYKAEDGHPGQHNNMSGKKGKNLYIKVPIGTTVIDIETSEIIFDIIISGQYFKIAQGGFKGLGNTCFKSSINQIPIKITNGKKGQHRKLILELKLIADVGILGLPNIGKTTLISVISRAHPKIANYPFTTLYPNLGVIKMGAYDNFIIIDIPPLIKGAFKGAGLGITFIKHLIRSRVLFHFIDISYSNPIESFKIIINELKKFSLNMFIKFPNWLILNKIDLLNEKKRYIFVKYIIKHINWKGPIFPISSITGEGCKELVEAIYLWLNKQYKIIMKDKKYLEKEKNTRNIIQKESLKY